MDTVKDMNIETDKNTRTRMPVTDMGIGIVPEFCSIKTDFRFMYKISKAIQHKKNWVKKLVKRNMFGCEEKVIVKAKRNKKILYETICLVFQKSFIRQNKTF